MIVTFLPQDELAPLGKLEPLELCDALLLFLEATTIDVVVHALLFFALLGLLLHKLGFAVVLDRSLSPPYPDPLIQFDSLNLIVECLSIADVLPELLVNWIVCFSPDLIIGIEKHLPDLSLVDLVLQSSIIGAYTHHALDFLLELLLNHLFCDGVQGILLLLEAR